MGFNSGFKGLIFEPLNCLHNQRSVGDHISEVVVISISIPELQTCSQLFNIIYFLMFSFIHDMYYSTFLCMHFTFGAKFLNCIVLCDKIYCLLTFPLVLTGSHSC